MLHRTVVLVAIALLTASVAKAQAEDSIMVRLKALGCGSECAVFQVTVFGNGLVQYVGDANVEVKGSRHKRIRIEDVKELIQRIDEALFFSLESSYVSRAGPSGVDSLGNQRYTVSVVQDAPESVVEVHIGDRRKAVYSGAFSPERLREIEADIIETSRIRGWVQKL